MGDKVMSAYVIVDLKVTDPQGYEAYKNLAALTVALYGGRYLARGGAAEVLEGNWVPNRLVILEFESSDRAKEWLRSKEYQPAREIRHRTAVANMILIPGA
jgi:uncharacterized protein (DUF1330 family)